MQRGLAIFMPLLLHSCIGEILYTNLPCLHATPANVCPNISYWLFNSKVSAYRLDMEHNNTLINAPFVRNAPTKFLLNGYNGTRDNFINVPIRSRYINKGYNVISLDYFSLVREPCFFDAVFNLDPIARCFANFYKRLLALQKLTVCEGHMIGYGLGAQIAGIAGNILKTMNITVYRITGLDPTTVFFYDSTSKLNNSTAAFVDAIHVDTVGDDYLKPVGHVDFYINGFDYRPQCIITELNWCRYNLSYEYYAESILEDHIFCGKKGKKMKARMGEYVSRSARGEYIVKTNKDYPYAKDTVC